MTSTTVVGDGVFVIAMPVPLLRFANHVLCMVATLVLETALETVLAAVVSGMIMRASTLTLDESCRRRLAVDTVTTTSSALGNCCMSAVRKPALSNVSTVPLTWKVVLTVGL